VLLAGVAVLAALIGRIADSQQMGLATLVLGAFATGLISEKTLIRIFRWTRK
jgi:hypothetical protein